MTRTRIFIVVVIALIGVGGMLALAPDTDPKEMRAKYANEHSRFLAAPAGLTIHYRDEGPRDAPVILLLHGNSSSLHAFDPLVERLDSEYRLIRYDHPGHGLTGPNDRQSYEYIDYAVAIEAIVRELELESFCLVGHSMGGWVAWRYAVDNPHRVDRLALVSASGMPIDADPDEVDSGLGFKLGRSAVFRAIGKRYTPRSIVADSAAASVVDQSLVTEAWVDRHYELLRMPGNREAFFARSVANREPELVDTVASISAPTLLLWGRQDSFNPVAAATAFAERIPNTETVIFDDIGHMPFIEAPDTSAEAVGRFCTGER
ncbi:MAG: alpha/beta hydrolase [Pseudomonadota bacterium]